MPTKAWQGMWCAAPNGICSTSPLPSKLGCVCSKVATAIVFIHSVIDCFLTLKEKQPTFPIFRRGRLCCRYMGIFKVQEWNWFHRVNLSRPVWGCQQRAGSVLSFLRRCGRADLTLFWCSRPCSTHSQRNYVGRNAMWFSFLSRRLWSISSNEPYLSYKTGHRISGHQDYHPAGSR